MKKETRTSRRFKGPLFPREEPVHKGFDGLKQNEYENMQKKHLKAYLKGDKFFIYKGTYHEVEQEYYEVQ